MIGVSSIDSLFSKIKIDEKGIGEESTLVRRLSYDLEGENLVEKIDKSGFEEVKTLTSDEPNIFYYKDFNYDSFSLVDCISLLQSMINSPHSYEQNKAFTLLEFQYLPSAKSLPSTSGRRRTSLPCVGKNRR